MSFPLTPDIVDELLYAPEPDLPSEAWAELCRMESSAQSLSHDTDLTSHAEPRPPSSHPSLISALTQPFLTLLSQAASPPPAVPTFPRVYPDLPSTPPRSQHTMPGSFEAYRSIADITPDSPPRVGVALEMREVESPSLRRRTYPTMTTGTTLVRLASELSIESPALLGARRAGTVERVESGSTGNMGRSSLLGETSGERMDTPLTSPEAEMDSLPPTPTKVGKRVRETDVATGTSKRARLSPPADAPALISTCALPPPCPALHLSPPPALQARLDRLPYAFAYNVYRLHARGVLPWSLFSGPIAETKLDELVLAWSSRSGPSTRKAKLWEIVKRLEEFLDEGERWRVGKTSRKAWEALEDEERMFGEGKVEEEGQGGVGRVRFSAVLGFKEDAAGSAKKGKGKAKGELELTLRPPAYALFNGNRLTRAYGSRAFLTLALDKDVQRDHSKPKLLDMLDDGIVLGGERFTPAFCKDGMVVCVSGREVRRRLGMMEEDEDEDTWFVRWVEELNPMEFNGDQSMGKWAKRWELFWSASIPGPRVRLDHMFHTDDIISDVPLDPVPAWANKTDGAGFMSWHLARAIQRILSLPYLPSAVQIRHAGCKGLYVLCPKQWEDLAEPNRLCVWVRPSQRKIQYGRPEALARNPTLVRALETVDILHPATITVPSRLTTKLLVVLAENGVPHSALVDLMEDSVRSAVQPFLKRPSESPTAAGEDSREATTLALCAAVEELGCVLPGRLRRAGMALRMRSVDDKEIVDEWGFSEHPGSRDECVLGALLSGGDVSTNLYLWRKVKQMLEGVLQGRVGDMKVPLRQSCDGMMIPDPYNVLKPGQIFVQFFREYEDEDGEFVKVLVRRCLLTRHPCMVPTDIQVVEAVDHQLLHGLVGVIVCSTQGPRSQASMSGGGDYDGDRGTLIWHPSLVDSFQPSPIELADPPAKFQECLERGGEMVSSVVQAMDAQGMGARERRRLLQRSLLDGVTQDYMMQTYSRLHDKALYMHGGHEPAVMDLAFKYCECLDSAKTGRTIKASIFSEDCAEWDKYNHPWKDAVSGKFTLHRLQSLGTFVLDSFRDRGKEMKAEILQTYERNLPIPMIEEAVLLEPWAEFCGTRARVGGLEPFRQAKMAIETHVLKVFEKYKQGMRQFAREKDVERRVGPPTTSAARPTPALNECLIAARALYASGPPAATVECLSREDVERYKASYAYTLDWKRTGIRSRANFPFEVAFWMMCDIMARASPTGVVVVTGCGYNALRLNKGFLKRMQQYNDLEDD